MWIFKIGCGDVHNIPIRNQCLFIRENSDCHEDEIFIAYSTFVFCNFGSGVVTPSLLILGVILILLFIGLGVTADDFLTPALITISKSLQLSQNFAGVTLLALGNGAPDIISSVASMSAARPELVLGELLGAGTFVTCVVVGTICLTQNFKIMERPLLRDIIFYIGATYWAFCAFYRRSISLVTSIGFIVVYLVYITVVCLSSIVYKKHKKKLPGTKELSSPVEAFTQLPQQIGVMSSLAPTENNSEAALDESMHDNPEYLGLVLRRSSFRNTQIRRHKATLSETRSRSNSAVSGTSEAEKSHSNSAVASRKNSAVVSRKNSAVASQKNSAVASRKNSAVASQKNSALGTGASRVSSTEDQNEHKLNHSSANYAFNNPIFTVTCATPTADSNGELVFPTDEDLSSQKQLSNGSVEDHNRKEFHNAEESEIPSREPYNAAQGSTEEDDKVEELPPLREFLRQVSPIDSEDWAEMNWFWRIFEIIKARPRMAPIYIVLALTTPVVDLDNHKGNWCRPLNVLHCMTSPLATVFILEQSSTLVHGFPLAVVVLLVGLALSLIVFFTSKHDQPPAYHMLYAYVGFVVTVLWVYMLANEVISLLKTVGIVLRMSDAFLGMTILAWGNSIGDLIGNVSVARQGYPRMAISACFGGPLLNLLLGIGVPFTYQLLSEGSSSIELKYTWLISLLYATICQGLVSTMVVMLILGFETRREFGFYLIALYGLFFVTSTVIEISNPTE